MRSDHSLRQRIARAFVMLALTLSSFFCVVSFIAVEVVEVQVLQTRLGRTADTLIGHHLRQEPFDLPPEISFFSDDAIPESLRSKPPGLHETLFEQREVQALVRSEDGHRYVILQEIEEFEHTEHIIFAALGIGFISSLILAVILGLATARRIVAPVTALTDAISADTAPSSLPSLDERNEIGVLARAFAHRTEELQHFLQRERLFTGDVSHELRTPLTVMLGAAELLTAQLADRPAQQAVAERMRRVAADTAQRVSAMLLLSRDPEKLSSSRIAINPLIRTELERCQPLLQGKPVVCRFEERADVWVQARAELIGIAIGNLLRNACQNTERGEVLIRLEPGCLRILDTGPGLPVVVRERLFERFVQGSSDSTEGTGLGLSIVKRVVEYLGWETKLELPETGGSHFIMTFPVIS